MTSGESEGTQASTVPEKNVVKNDTTAREISEEERCSGNVSMADKVITHHAKDTKSYKHGSARSPIASVPRYVWPNYEFQWRFPGSPHYRPFYNSNRLFNAVQPYLNPRGYYRTPLYDHVHRFYNTFLPFEQGRRGGKFSSYSKSNYGYRQYSNSFKSATMKKSDVTNKSGQNHVSTSNTNVSSGTEPDNNVRNVNINTALDSDYSISNEKNNVNPNELLNEKVKDTQIEDCNIESLKSVTCIDNLKSQDEVKSIQENSATISLSNDTECKDVNIENNICNEVFRETVANPLTNSHDDSMEMIEDKASENNVNSDCSDPSGSNDFKILEKLLTEGTTCKSDNDEVAEYIKKDNVNSEVKNETITIDLDTYESEQVEQIDNLEKHEPNTSEQSVDVNQRVESTESNCESVLNSMKEEKLADSEPAVNGELVNDRVENNFNMKEEGLTVQNIKLSEHNEDNVLEGNGVVLNDLVSKEDDKELNVIENNALREPLDESAECDKNQLNRNNSTNSIELATSIVSEDQLEKPKMDVYEQTTDASTKNSESIQNENLINSEDHETLESPENIEPALNKSSKTSVKLSSDSSSIVTDTKDSSGDSDKKNIEAPVTTRKRRRRTRKMLVAAQEAAGEEDQQGRTYFVIKIDVQLLYY